MVHSLIENYGLLKHMKILHPKQASVDDITLFHSSGYVECLKKLSDCDDEEKYDEEAEEYGLTYDCPAYCGVFEYASTVVGASITAAHCLVTGVSNVAINWMGGWHHAKRDMAEGFCYFNDIVIAILKLRTKFDRVLYIDLDLHHGNGVEDAFCATSKVMTLSFHKTAPGFFPGTGRLGDIGIGKGKGYSVNIPLEDGTDDQEFCDVFDRVTKIISSSFPADCFVCQCGADGLTNDPMATFNLTNKTFTHCIKKVMSWNKPTLLLGGGGYNFANTARCWTELTATVLGKNIPAEIPEHQFFERYGPDYDLEITAGNRTNTNKRQEIDYIIGHVQNNMDLLKPAEQTIKKG